MAKEKLPTRLSKQAMAMLESVAIMLMTNAREQMDHEVSTHLAMVIADNNRLRKENSELKSENSELRKGLLSANTKDGDKAKRVAKKLLTIFLTLGGTSLLSDLQFFFGDFLL